MILLEAENLLIKELLGRQFAKPSAVDQTLTDFDGVRYHIESTKTGPLTLSMSINCWQELAECGCLDILKREYGPYIKSDTEIGYNITLEFDQTTIPADEGTYQKAHWTHTDHHCITRIAKCIDPVFIPLEAKCCSCTI